MLRGRITLTAILEDVEARPGFVSANTYKLLTFCFTLTLLEYKLLTFLNTWTAATAYCRLGGRHRLLSVGWTPPLTVGWVDGLKYMVRPQTCLEFHRILVSVYHPARANFEIF